MPSPTRARSRSRSRSRSPVREPRAKNYSGLKWKGRDRDDDRRRDRGDRDHRRRDRDRDGDRDDRRRDDRFRDRDRDRDRGQDRDRGRYDRDSERSSRPAPRDDRGLKSTTAEKPKALAEKSKPAPVSSGEPMIIVTVNDRLGTKAQIPCLASDPVKVFKAMVAARIGRPAHEIMIKRQGERPFKDQLSLEDYGVSNGVQLDLELDTGD